MKEYLVRMTDTNGNESYVNDIMRTSAYFSDELDSGMKFTSVEQARQFLNFLQRIYPTRVFHVISRETVVTVEGE